MLDFPYETLVRKVSAMSGILGNLLRISTVRQRPRPSRAKDCLDVRPGDANRSSVPASQVGCKNCILWIAMSIVLGAPQSVFACAACTGRSDDAAALGLNAAVFTLLLVLLVVYGAIGCSLAYFIRRAAKHPLPLRNEQEGPFDDSHRVRSFHVNSRATGNSVASIASRLNRQTPQECREERYESERN